MTNMYLSVVFYDENKNVVRFSSLKVVESAIKQTVMHSTSELDPKTGDVFKDETTSIISTYIFVWRLIP